jgi:lysophospholipase L1-like esterase
MEVALKRRSMMRATLRFAAARAGVFSAAWAAQTPQQSPGFGNLGFCHNTDAAPALPAAKPHAPRRGYPHVDNYTAMKDERSGLPAALSKYGVHPLRAGYALMAPLVEARIDSALKGTK